MKNHMLWVLILALLPFALGGQRGVVNERPDRFEIQVSRAILEIDPPSELHALVDLADSVVVATVQSAAPLVLDTGEVITRYSVIAKEVVVGELPIRPFQLIFLDMPGGVALSGRKLLKHENELHSDLISGADYVLFMMAYPASSPMRNEAYRILFGRYSAFRILSDRVVPDTPGKHELFRKYAGLTVSDLVGMIKARFSEPRTRTKHSHR